MNANEIIVGIDDSPSARAALSWAEVEEAHRLPSTRVFEEVHPEPHWTLQFAQGHAGRIMVGESKDAKLLVLGAREHRGLERLLVGSVGHYCLSHAFCPVVSVPPPEKPGDTGTTDQAVRANAG